MRWQWRVAQGPGCLFLRGHCLLKCLAHAPHAQPAKAMVEAAAARGVKLLLPRDVLVSESLERPQVCGGVPAGPKHTITSVWG